MKAVKLAALGLATYAVTVPVSYTLMRLHLGRKYHCPTSEIKWRRP